jgi:PilZ domain
MLPFLVGMTATPTVQDARAAERRRVKIRALVREVGSARVDIDVVDLSASGFRFESFYGFAPGARVFLSVPSLGPLEAVIAWRGRNQFGCRFLKPLHQAVFDTIAARFA